MKNFVFNFKGAFWNLIQNFDLKQHKIWVFVGDLWYFKVITSQVLVRRLVVVNYEFPLSTTRIIGIADESMDKL